MPKNASDKQKNRRQSTSSEAIQYTHNEILWSTIYLKAWQDPEYKARLKKVQAKTEKDPDAVNNFLVEEACKLGLSKPEFLGVKTQFVFDTKKLVHLRVPAYENMPRSPVAMVPYNI